MKIAIIIFLLTITTHLMLDKRDLKRQLRTRSNLTRSEMKEALYEAVNDSIALYIPGDTNIMPYLFKVEREIEMELVRR